MVSPLVPGVGGRPNVDRAFLFGRKFVHLTYFVQQRHIRKFCMRPDRPVKRR
jgi:hypothetical protein